MQILTSTKLVQFFVKTDDFLLELHLLIKAEGLPEAKWHCCFPVAR